MKKKDVDCFEKISGQLEGVYTEVTFLSKKSPNDGVNKFKLQFINQILKDANSLLDIKHKPFDDFTIFEEDALPTNSDVAFIISQYLNSMENFRNENIQQHVGSWYWVINGEKSSERTTPPKKLIRR